MKRLEKARRMLWGDSRAASRESAVEDTPGSPTWPIQSPDSNEPSAPPVGLSWSTVSEGLGIDLRLLQHEGIVVLAGEYFPESGFFFDPDTLLAQHVDVGDVALRHGYFLGNITARDFAEWFQVAPGGGTVAGLPVVRSESGPIIGLFRDELSAKRATSVVLQGSLGSGIRLERGPLGSELTVGRAEQPGAVATAVAALGGAVISIGGRPVGTRTERGPLTTAAPLPSPEGDRWRPGTGATSDSQTPSVELGGSEEFPRL